ncbi:MAG: hypothetical protein H7831_09180 [Magnetococcus sp. WYHC-3]
MERATEYNDRRVLNSFFPGSLPMIPHVHTPMILASLLVSGLFGMMGVSAWSVVGLAMVTFFFLNYISSLGKNLAIMELIAFVAALQWVLGPIIEYNLDAISDSKYRMYVGESLYLGYAVPSMALFTMGLFMFRRNIDFREFFDRLRQFLRLRRSVAVGFIIGSSVLVQFTYALPQELRFVVFLVSQFKFIGILYLFMARSPDRWLWLGIVGTVDLLDSVEKTMFHNFILWATLIFSFVCLDLRISWRAKILITLLGIGGLVVIQSVKGELRRAEPYLDASDSRVERFVELVKDPFAYTQAETLEGRIQELNVRLNQGWIVSAVMRYVPSREPHANGVTIWNAVVDSLLPRIISANKSTAGGAEVVKKYSGLSIGSNTSMGISILGEAYVNFGRWGGMLFMLVWGALLSYILSLFLRMSQNHPSMILWVPLLFLQVIKAETELVVVLNHAVKSIIVVLLLYYFGRAIVRL